MHVEIWDRRLVNITNNSTSWMNGLSFGAISGFDGHSVLGVFHPFGVAD